MAPVACNTASGPLTGPRDETEVQGVLKAALLKAVPRFVRLRVESECRVVKELQLLALGDELPESVLRLRRRLSERVD